MNYITTKDEGRKENEENRFSSINNLYYIINHSPISWDNQMNDIIFKNHDRPQRIGFSNDVLFRATVHQGSKKRSRKKIHAGKKTKQDIL